VSAAAKGKTTPTVEAVLGYLQHRLPTYPFDAELDGDFVSELADDFADVDILEETKSFRWYYCQKQPSVRSMRLALRRWIANARTRHTQRTRS